MTRRRGVARILLGLVLVAGSVLGTFVYNPRPDPEPTHYICFGLRCSAMANEAGAP